MNPTLLQKQALQILSSSFTRGLYSINSMLSSSAEMSRPPSRRLNEESIRWNCSRASREARAFFSSSVSSGIGDGFYVEND